MCSKTLSSCVHMDIVCSFPSPSAEPGLSGWGNQEEILHGLNMWWSVSDDKGKEDTNEQIFEGTGRQAYVKDNADLRSNGRKERKEVYANSSIS